MSIDSLQRVADAPEQQADSASREGERRSSDRTRDTEAQLVSGDDSAAMAATRAHHVMRLARWLTYRSSSVVLHFHLLTHSLRKLNSSPSTVEEKEYLKKMLTTPPVKRIDLHFPLGLEVTARNLRGVTIKDALDAIYKQYKKKVRFPGFCHTALPAPIDFILTFPSSPTTSSPTPTSKASSGTARSATHASSSTR